MGMNIYEVLRKHAFAGLSNKAVASMSGQLVRTLCCLSAAGVIHSDLKPENILLVK